MKMNKINEVKSDFEIIEMDELEGLTITKKANNEKVTIYDPILISEIVDKNFEKKYKKLLYMVMMFNELDDSSSDDAEGIILQIEAFRNYLINKYYKLIGNGKLNQYIEMLLMLESQVNLNMHKGR